MVLPSVPLPVFLIGMCMYEALCIWALIFFILIFLLTIKLYNHIIR
jgi:hypothetical protein